MSSGTAPFDLASRHLHALGAASREKSVTITPRAAEDLQALQKAVQTMNDRV